MSTRQCVTACRIESGAQKTTFQLAAYQGSHPPGGQGRPDHVQPRGAARIESCSRQRAERSKLGPQAAHTAFGCGGAGASFRVARRVDLS